MTNLKSHPVPTYAAYGGVPTDEAYGGEPQYIATPFGWVKNDAEYKKYMAQKQQETPIPKDDEQPNRQQNQNNAYLDFNGRELRWHQNNEVTNLWKAMSGQPNYQCKEYDSLKDKGPLPEGKWLVRQSQHQNFYKDQSKFDQFRSEYGFGIMGKWRGGKDSWGNNRIWLEPAQGTDNKDRAGLSIHGGKEYGSGGCIDLTDKMDEFTDKFKKYGRDMLLNVKYDKDCW